VFLLRTIKYLALNAPVQRTEPGAAFIQMNGHEKGKPMRVSIVTPSFNQAQFLEAAILSVRAQDYADIEHIVIDGGSTDASVEIIRKYADRIAYWVSEPDRGQTEAINKGFRRAQGEIITWLNSDDVFFSRDAVSKMVEAFAANPQVDLIYGDAATIDERGYVRRIRRLPDFDQDRLLRTSYLVQPAIFFRSRILARHQLDESLHLGMDYKLWLELAREFRFWHVPQIIAGDRNHLQRKTVIQRGIAEQMERTLQREWGGASGFRRAALRLYDQVLAIFRRFRGIPDMLELYRRSDLAFDARLRSKPAAIWDQIFGKDYQKI
jgi:glycosyltransferase involved in cell wall biosynthesis